MLHKIFLFVLLGCFLKLFAQPEVVNYTPDPIQPQTASNFNVIKPENVLVVFKRGDQVSENIMNYYKQKRGIPTTNIVKGLDGQPGLSLPDSANYDGQYVFLDQEGEIIRRADPCSQDGNNSICDTLAFYYYYEKIAQPITNYLNNTIDPNTGNYLKDQIHYIVLCKGIPLKIKSADRGWITIWTSYHISIDGLLCLLKTNNNNNPSIMKLYPKPSNIYYNCRVTNPYNGIDPYFNFNNRFKSKSLFAK